MKRFLVVMLVAVSTVALWQFLPTPSVQAGPAVDQQMSKTNSLPASFADVIEAVQPAVVNISVSGTVVPEPPGGAPVPPGMEDFQDFLRRFFERQSHSHNSPGSTFQGMGSGFIVAPEGYVVTNRHVISHATEIAVLLNDGSRLEAELVGSDPKTDLAVLKVDPDEPLPYARFGDSDETRVGDWVIAIGNPFGLGGSATTGIVSARGRDIRSGPYDDFLQIDAPINRGNSGGPLFDLNGRVIGINTAIFSPNGGNVGIGFAIPSNLAGDVIDQLRTSGHVERGWLGVTIQQVDEDLAAGLGFDGDAGALVASVVSKSPAEKAGLRPGDVIVGIEGENVSRVKELTRKVASVKPDNEVELEVWRDGERKSVAVVVGQSPEDVSEPRAEAESPGGKLGVALAELTPEWRQKFRIDDDVEGALIVGVEPASGAASKGLRAGDVIVMVGRTPVANVEDALRLIEDAKTGNRGSVVLRVLRGGASQFVAIPFE